MGKIIFLNYIVFNIDMPNLVNLYILPNSLTFAALVVINKIIFS